PDDDRPEPIMTMALTFPDLQGSMLKQKAPDIVLRNQQGAAYPLSALKGKTTLVYFWATWSGPARENHTDLNKIHAKYGKSAFDIYGVAFEKDVNRWEKAVQDDQLEWNNHLIDTKGTESSVLEKYKVKYLPAMFLLDENGTVVAENLTYEQLDAELGRRLQK
ncbi:MAG: TlpA family protein disulfide reductase, partial [Chitinophagales bacterium]